MLLWAFLFFAATMTVSCTKWDDLTSPREGTVYMAQAGEKGELHFFRIDSAQSFFFGASIGGFNGAPEHTNVSFELLPELVTQFNEDHAYLNYNFVPLPASAFTVSGLESTIEKGVSDSKALEVTVMVNKLDPYTDYCLPIRIKSVSSGTLDSITSISYFYIDSLYIRARDIPGILTVAKDNNGGAEAKEGSTKLTDNNYGSKFLYEFDDNTWMQLELAQAEKLNAYELTSGNDAPERDPKDWQFQGSNDGISWTVLDEQHDYRFYSRNQTIRFEYDDPNDRAYKYYRFFVQHNNGSSLFQMTEWRLLQYY